MAVAIKIQTITKETIKPSSPTPLHLKTFQLSHQDQLSPVCYIQLLLFYSSNAHSISLADHTTISHHLKDALSKTLSPFYPFAGRIKDHRSIECNDDGVEYVTARVDCGLSEVLASPDLKILNQFLPADILSDEAVKGPMLLVQASFFDCGGMALGVCLSHKVADAATLSRFIRCWAATARNSTDDSFKSPDFIGPSVFPPSESSMNSKQLLKQTCVSKRFVFDVSRLTTLKANLATESIPNPTRVESVSSLIFKCATLASRSSANNTEPCRPCRPSIWSFKVNLRKRFVVPLPETYFGNCSGTIESSVQDIEQTDLQAVAELLRKGIQEFRQTGNDPRGDEEMLGLLFGANKGNEEIDVFHCTSWCNLDLYDADFGWGKPLWETTGDIPFKNTVLLMDTRDRDGIEAYVCLTEEDMTSFETNEELLRFASLNPNIF